MHLHEENAYQYFCKLVAYQKEPVGLQTDADPVSDTTLSPPVVPACERYTGRTVVTQECHVWTTLNY